MIIGRLAPHLLLVTMLAWITACASPAGAPEGELTQITRSPAAASTTASASPTSTSTTTPEPDAAAPTTTPAATGASVTISAVGDISLARQVNDWMEQNGAGYPYELIQPLLTGDIVFGNLEGALTDGGEPWPKAFNFRTPPQFASGLAAAGFDVVSLANNHAMDYGVTGLQDTVIALEGAGVRHAGSGDLRRGLFPTIVQANGFTVAFIACVLTPDEGSGFSIFQWEWTVETPTGLFVCDASRFEGLINDPKTDADFVVVSIHAGDEYVNAPNATQRELAEAALAAGADVVLGHHAHVVQPVEQRGNRLIAWGLGNFIFDLDQWDLAGIPEPRVSLILNITLTKGIGVTAWEAVPVTLDAEADRPRPATADEAAVLQQLIQP
jgi:poly-gamma-glutamate synthesis protein (capsule biosynthesis protein)